MNYILIFRITTYAMGRLNIVLLYQQKRRRFRDETNFVMNSHG
jgi:hypothetical protein